MLCNSNTTVPLVVQELITFLQFHKVKRYQQGNQWKNHRQYNPIVAKRERRKGQTIIYKTLHKKQNIRILTFLEERTHHKR
jgi:hypothetical protein